MYVFFFRANKKNKNSEQKIATEVQMEGVHKKKI